MVPDATGALVQAGVVSWGFGCGYPTQYGVYARIGDDTLYNWITPRLSGGTTTSTPTKTTGKKQR